MEKGSHQPRGAIYPSPRPSAARNDLRTRAADLQAVKQGRLHGESFAERTEIVVSFSLRALRTLRLNAVVATGSSAAHARATWRQLRETLRLPSTFAKESD